MHESLKTRVDSQFHNKGSEIVGFKTNAIALHCDSPLLKWGRRIQPTVAPSRLPRLSATPGEWPTIE